MSKENRKTDGFHCRLGDVSSHYTRIVNKWISPTVDGKAARTTSFRAIFLQAQQRPIKIFHCCGVGGDVVSFSHPPSPIRPQAFPQSVLFHQP